MRNRIGLEDFVEGASDVPVERAFGAIVVRRLLAYQAEYEPEPLSDVAMARLLRVHQSHWLRIRRGDLGAGGRVVAGAAVALPEVVRAAVDEVQALKAAEVERLRRGPADVGAQRRKHRPAGDVDADVRAPRRPVGAAT